MRILLVEDNADHRELMRLALTGHDATWQVEGVVSGEEALRHLAEGEAYDVVFLDYSLPRRDGLEVLEEIRRGEAPPPVVMVTGRGDEQVAVEAMKGGAYDYVVKGEGYLQRLPVVAQRAVEAHQLAVEHKRAEEALRASEQLLEKTFASLRDAVFIIDADTVGILNCNPAASEIFGYSRQEMLGRTTALLHVDEAARKEFRRHLDPAIEEKGFLGHLEFRMRRKDGTVFPSEHSVVPLEEERGERVGWVSVVRDITERKRAEEALRFTRFSVDNAADTMVWVDHDARFIDVNDAFCRSSGYSREELLSMSVHDIDPDYSAEIWPEFWEKLKQSGSLTFESCHRTKEGKLFSVEITANFLEYNGKEYHCSVARDITERKRAEEALRESEAQLRELYDEAPVGYHELDGEGRLRRVNRTELAMLGYTAEEMIGRPVWEFVLEREAAHRAVLAKLAGSNLVPAFERTYLRKDGTQVPVLIEDRLLRDAEGRVTGIRSTIQDISVRKQAEEAARENQRVLEAVLETTRALIVLADSEGRILLFNRACEELTGYSRQEVLGKPIADCFPDQAWVSIALKLLVDREGPGLLVPHECPWQTASGEQRLIEWRFRVFPSPRDGRPCVLGTGTDITVRKRAEEELGRLHEEAEQRGQEAETFATLLRDLASSLELDEVLTHVVAKAKDLSEGDLAFLALVEADGKSLTIRTQTGAASTRLAGLTLTRGQGMAGKVLETGEILTTADYLGDSRFSHEYDASAHAEGILAQAAVPVLHEGASLGVLLVARRTARPFTPADLQVLARLADAASLACHHALVYRQAANRAVVLERLWWGSQVLSRSLTLSVTLDRIVQTAQDLLRSDYARLALWDAATQCLTHATQAGGEALSIRQVCHPGEGMSGTVAKTRFPLILNDYQAFPPRLPEAARITAGMAVPLLIEDRLIGTLSVGTTELGRSFATEDLHLLELLAQPATVAIENARLHSAAVRRGQEIEALLRATRSVMSGLDLQGILDRILTEAAEISGYLHVKVLLVDKEAGVLRVGALQGTAMSREDRLPLGRGHSGIVAATGQPLFSDDCPNDPRNAYAERDRELGIVTYLGLPIKSGDEVIGVLTFNTTAPRRYTDDEVAYLTSFADQAAVAIENARLFEEVQVSRKRLQALSRRQLDLQENERRSLARELHDEIGQLLTGLKLVLEMAAVSLPETSQDSLRESQALVGELIGHVRELSLNLRPSILDDLGLLPALLWQFERYTAQTRIQVNFEHAGLEGRRCAPEMETAAYRIVQEALTNVARHAQVDAVEVKVWIEGCMLLVRIEDHGCGFEPTLTLVPGASSGLAGMRERATLLGGRMRIESSPGAGTLILAELPLDLSPDNSRRS